MPGDPQIDEATCLLMLQQSVNAETIPYIQNAATQVMMDLYDRKATREEFGKHAGTAVSLYATLAKLNIILQVADLIAAAPLDPEKLEHTRAELQRIAAGKMAALARCMTMLAQCPWSEDRVH